MDQAALSAKNPEELQDASMSPQDLLTLFPSENIQMPEGDVTAARFFDEFMADPSDRNAALKKEREEMMKDMSREQMTRLLHSALHNPLRKYRRYDFRLDEREEAVFRKNGFVVSERMRVQSFAEAYYRIYTDDLPVFVSADSVLHAWHRSYDAMLCQLEEHVLSLAMTEILVGMSRAIPKVVIARGVGDSAPSPPGVPAHLRKRICSPEEVPLLEKSGFPQDLADADVFLTVAISLLEGDTAVGMLGEVTDSKVSTILSAIQAERCEELILFGAKRETDFSMFKPRGHYTRSPFLKRYFQCVMWLGRADMRVSPPESNSYASGLLQLTCALTLLQLAQLAGKLEMLASFDDLIGRFVGEKDCAGLTELRKICLAAGVPPEELDSSSSEHVERVYDALMASGVGIQRIMGDVYHDINDGVSHDGLPRSICMMGQRFIIDSWMLMKLVYDGQNCTQRRVPSALDVAFGTFGNTAALPYIINRMHRSPANASRDGAESFVPFRDGVEYQRELAAAHRDVDTLALQKWESSIYHLWIGTLRVLSSPHPWSASADCLGTTAWQAREMNTQLASWTQLRHDTVLYAKQGFTCRTCCEYPAGLVEPRPEFWWHMQYMSKVAADLLSSVLVEQLMPGTRLNEVTKEERCDDRNAFIRQATPKQILSSMAQFLRGFGETMAKLRDIADAQVARQELTAEQDNFLKTVMEERHGSGGTRYLGWYPRLFYTSREDSGKREVLVADVHTDPVDTNSGDPGCILHEGVGDVNMMIMVADTASGDGEEPRELCCYAGPVFSHYEFCAPVGKRLSDEDWKQVLDNGSGDGIQMPPNPEWTQEWLVNDHAKGQSNNANGTQISRNGSVWTTQSPEIAGVRSGW